MPHVYFLQPAELVGTDRYKIGMSIKNDLKHVKSYRTGTRYLCIMESDIAIEVERSLITAFRDKFVLVDGNEYFKIDDESMALQIFILVVADHNQLSSISRQLTKSDSNPESSSEPSKQYTKWGVLRMKYDRFIL